MLKSKFYEVNQERALTILKELPSVVKGKIYETKLSTFKTVFPPLNIAFIKMKIDDLQKNNKPNIKNVNIPIIGPKCDKNEFKEDIPPKNEKFIKEIYISELSSSSLNISTDYLSSRRDKKFSLFQSREKSRFKFADSSNEINSIPETILTFISRKTSTHFHLRNVDIDITSGFFSEDLKEWENLTMLNAVSQNYN
jgi:hypothetical protein